MATPTYASDFGEKFQARILAVALLSPTFVLRYRSAISHEYFESDAHRIIAKCLLSIVDKYGAIPSKDTLEVDLKAVAPKDDLETIEAVASNLYGYDISDEAAVIDKAVAFGKHQALINAVIASGDDIVSKKTDKIEDRIRGAFAVGEDLLNIGIDYQVFDRLDHYLKKEDDNIQRIPTGIIHVDAAMSGGPKRGTLNVILAPPKKGKSTTLVNIAFGAAQAGHKVVYYSLEMDKCDVTERFDDRLMGPDIALKATDPETYVEQLQKRVADEVPGNIFVQQYFTRKASVSTIRAHLSLLKARGFTPDMVVVDYADILKASTRLGEMRHEQAGIYEELRTLAGEYDVVLWTASQTNKAGLEKEVVTIADFAESFEKAAIADAVWALCQTASEMIQRKCRLFAAALRKSEDSVTVECDIRRDQCLIRSTGLYDAGYNQIHTKSDQASEAPKSDKLSKPEEAVSVTKMQAIKESAGMVKKPDVRRRAGPPPGKPAVQIGVRPGSQVAPRRRAERPTTTVAPKP
jgi:replicative DNA helicase